MKEIYLDNSASTRVFPEVAREIRKTLEKNYGNPSSSHKLGEEARKLIDKARAEFAREIGAKIHEIIFTSGASESNSLALLGLRNSRKKKIIISSIEHPSLKESARAMRGFGFKVEEIGLDKEGKIDLEKLDREIDKSTLLVSIIHANNITGLIQDLDAIGKICKRKKVFFHTDAVQSFGKIRIDVRKSNLDMMSASAHKIGGPKGIGLLYVREGILLDPLIYGGGQERGLRNGTENVSGIVGFAKALEIIKRTDKEKSRALKTLLEKELSNMGARINSSEEGLYNIIHASFPGRSGDEIVMKLSARQIYVSSGSACESRREKEDYVLEGSGLTQEEIKGSIRISLGPFTKKKELVRFVKEIRKIISS